MKSHFEAIEYMYGKSAIRLPNSIFRNLSSSIRNKSGKINIQQVAFAYTYLITISLLYKYSHFVDVGSGVYIQNGDIKELLGYNRMTKTIDKVIKKGGILDEMGLTATTKDYPIGFETNKEVLINGIPMREFITIEDLDSDDVLYEMIKEVVKNKNYEIKEPLFLSSEYKENYYGTLYGIERTHEITLEEFLAFVFDDEMDNIDFYIYGYLKSRCKGYKHNMKSIAVYKIVLELGIDKSAFYNHIDKLKKKGYISVKHMAWKMRGERYADMTANEYTWIGV